MGWGGEEEFAKPPKYPYFICKKYIPPQNNHTHIVSCREDAVSEIVSFLLILGVVAAGVGIYAAVAEPEIFKAEERQHLESAAERFSSLKSDIDRLWVLGTPGDSGSKLLPLGAADRTSSGTLSFGKGTPIRFSHPGGEKTASLLRLDYTYRAFQYRIVYEGGAVFSAGDILLPAAAGETKAVLICTDQTDDVILANTPVAVTYVFQKTETFSGIENLQIAESPYSGYWQETLAGMENITLVYCTLFAEAVP